MIEPRSPNSDDASGKAYQSPGGQPGRQCERGLALAAHHQLVLASVGVGPQSNAWPAQQRTFLTLCRTSSLTFVRAGPRYLRGSNSFGVSHITLRIAAVMASLALQGAWIVIRLAWGELLPPPSEPGARGLRSVSGR